MFIEAVGFVCFFLQTKIIKQVACKVPEKFVYKGGSKQNIGVLTKAICKGIFRDIMKKSKSKKSALDFEKEYEIFGDNAGTKLDCGSVAEACAEIKKRMISMRVETVVIEKLKVKANRVGIPYQTLAASVLKRYAEGNLDIEPA